jgi:uncharacterized membrane protein (UPF0127 family)
MRGYVRVEREDGTVVCERCVVADTPLQRLRGLLGRKDLDADAGMLLRRVNAIHMFFMRFAIDAIFVDKELAVVKVREQVRPWRVAGARGAKAVLELHAGEARRRGVAPGDRLRIVAAA